LKSFYPIYELTGVPASGKSTILKNDNSPHAFDFVKPQKSKDNIEPSKFSFEKFWFLFKSSLNSHRTVYHKCAALYHSLIKLSQRNPPLIIDEGITHIPFLFDLTAQETIDFAKLFKTYLSKTHVIILKCDKDVLIERLVIRGHKRINKSDLEQVKMFVDTNLNTVDNIEKVYSDYCYAVTIINTSEY
jgi:hypothetical protein